MNKIIAVAAVFFTVIFLGNSLIQAEEVKKPHQKKDFLKTVDKNTDGKVSKQEFMAAMEKKFNSMDVDKSAVVSVQELKIYGEKDEEARKKAQQAAKQATKLEKIISKKKFTQLFTVRAEREFAKLDKNHDQELSANEAGVNKLKKKNQKTLPRLEKKLSKADFVAVFTANAERNFTKLDKNRDGKLTDSELGIAKATPKTSLKPALPELHSLSSLFPTTFKPKAVDQTAEQKKLIKSFFVGIDANNDGQISSKEKQTVFERLFNRLDTNHDQLVTRDEIEAGRHLPLNEKP